jgi:hypothetical protein
MLTIGPWKTKNSGQLRDSSRMLNQRRHIRQTINHDSWLNAYQAGKKMSQEDRVFYSGLNQKAIDGAPPAAPHSAPPAVE